MSTLNVNNINEAGGVDAVITAGVLDSGSLPAGSILQVVRATDTTQRTTTSNSFVDANIAVTITPKFSSSNIILIWSANMFANDTEDSSRGYFQITNVSDVAISGAEDHEIGNVSDGVGTVHQLYSTFSIFGFDSPATTSAITYKGRFHKASSCNQVVLENAASTGQMFAIEVAA